MAAITPRDARDLDIVLFGATGFTGRLVAEHLLKTYGVGRDLKWAMAGRSAGKLAEIRTEIGAPDALDLITVDAADNAALSALAARTRVVITTVGPYQLYGEPILAACAAQGTDYVDLTGESNWIAAMLPKYEAAAKASGARIVFSSGFDSVPFDLGVYYTQEQAKARFGAYAPRVRGRLRSMSGGISGGTIASGMATMAAAQQNPEIAKLLANPFALTPGFEGAPQPDLNATYEDTVTGSWVGPFMMSAINTKAVHRSNVLLGLRWGRDFQYDEMMMLPGPPKAGGGGGSGAFGLGAGPMPKPGEGPSKDERENGFYDLLFIAEYPDGRTLRASVKGDKDPGYGSTSKMLGESALCLLRDVPASRTPGGMWTSSAALGDALIKRLESHAGLRFSVES